MTDVALTRQRADLQMNATNDAHAARTRITPICAMLTSVANAHAACVMRIIEANTPVTHDA
jgi:hypothetical protein